MSGASPSATAADSCRISIARDKGATDATPVDYMEDADDATPEEDTPLIHARSGKRRQADTNRRERIGDIAFCKEKSAARTGLGLRPAWTPSSTALRQVSPPAATSLEGLG